MSLFFCKEFLGSSKFGRQYASRTWWTGSPGTSLWHTALENHQSTIKVNNLLHQHRYESRPFPPPIPPYQQCSQSATLKNQKTHSKTQISSPSLLPFPQSIQLPFPLTSPPPPPPQHNPPPPPPSPLKGPKP